MNITSMLGNVWRFDVNDNLPPGGLEATLIGTTKTATGTAQPITVRPELAENNLFQPIVDKLLKKNPDDRYQTATELRLDVEHALNAVLLKKGASS